VPADEREQAVARLRKSGEAFKRIKRSGESPSVALTLPLLRLSGRLRGSDSRGGLVC
jgi:hypothetical protein